MTTTKEVIEHYPSDNPAEEFAEDIIEEKTGFDVDLSFWDDDEEKGWYWGEE